MKVVFPIYRFNWYRTVAPVIEEVLKRGHEVTCWHNCSDNNTGANRPDFSLLPSFLVGEIKVVDYNNNAELDDLVSKCKADVIVSIDTPLDHWISEDYWTNRTFRYVAITTPDTLRRVTSRSLLESCDLFAVRSVHEIESCIKDHTLDYRSFLKECDKIGVDANLYAKLVSPRIGMEWDESMVSSFRERCVVTGYPFLDAIEKIEEEHIRRKWNIPDGKRIVGLWSTPHHGRGFHGHWDRILSEPNRIKQLLLNLKYYGLNLKSYLLINETMIVNAVREFAHRNDALLITKMRHYQTSENCLYSSLSDIVVGEDSFYPHTGMELAAVADVMFGFRTTGTTEAVYTGCPVVDVVVPGARREFHSRSMHFLEGMYDHAGIVSSRSCKWMIEKLANSDLNDFNKLSVAHSEYKEKFCGPEGGHFSKNVVNAIEHKLSKRT